MNDLFKNIPEKVQNKILELLKSFTYSFTNNVIIPKDIFYSKSILIVLEGTIEINKLDYNDNETTIDLLTKNDIITTFTIPFLDNDYTLYLKEQTKILVLDFNFIISNEVNNKYYNQLLKNLLDILSKKMININNRMEIMSNKTIRNKLLTFFKQQSKKYNNNIIYLSFNFTSLSNYLCVDRSAMNRELKHLKDENLIEIKGRRIKLNYYLN